MLPSTIIIMILNKELVPKIKAYFIVIDILSNLEMPEQDKPMTVWQSLSSDRLYPKDCSEFHTTTFNMYAPEVEPKDS